MLKINGDIDKNKVYGNIINSNPKGRITNLQILGSIFNNGVSGLIRNNGVSGSLTDYINPVIPVIYCDEAKALFNRMIAVGEEPSISRKSAINRCIISLKENNLWSTQFDVLVVTRAHGAQSGLLNWIKNSNNGIAVNNTNFVVDVGYNSNGTSSYIDSNYTTSGGVTFKQDDACFLYKQGGTLGSADSYCGTFNNQGICIGRTGLHMLNKTEWIGSGKPTALGYNCVSRNNNQNYQIMRNGLTDTLTSVSAGLNNYKIAMMAARTSLNITNYWQSVEKLELYAMGKALTQEQFLVFQNIMTTYFIECYMENIVFEEDTINLLKRMECLPTSLLANLIDKTIKDLKTAGIWSKTDCLYFRNVHTSQAACLNWIKDAHNSTLYNSPTFITKQGIKCAAGKYINNNYIPATQGVNFQIRNSSILFLNYQLNTIYAGYENFVDATLPAYRIYLTNYLTSTNRQYYCNSSSYAVFGLLAENKVYGAGVQWDNGFDYIYTYVNGIQYTAPRWATQSTSLPNLSTLESYGTNGTRSFSMFASKLTASEHLAVNNIVHYFCDNVTEYSNELVTNGGFDSDTDWTKGAGWTISDGLAHSNNGAGSFLYEFIPITINHTYIVTYTITNYTSGTTQVIRQGGYVGTINSVNGTYTEYFTATVNSTWIGLKSNNFIGDIDNLSIKEII